MLGGNGGQDIFSDESDRIRFYDLLEESSSGQSSAQTRGNESLSGG